MNAFLIDAVKNALQQTETRFREDFAQLQQDLSEAWPEESLESQDSLVEAPSTTVLARFLRSVWKDE